MATPAFLKYPTKKLRSLKNPLRQIHLRLIGHRHEIKCATAEFGVAGAEWVVCTTPMNEQSIVYSFGVGNDASFDLDLIHAFGCTVFGFDPTPRSAQWVRSQKLPARFVFHELGIAARDGTLKFFEPRSNDSFHFTPVQRYHDATDEETIEAPVRTLGTIMHDLGHDHVDLLKLDIEGGEYDVIDDLVRSTVRPTQILVEFHHMFSTIPMKKTLHAVEALRGAGYGIVHISPRTYEYTFMRRGAI